jgi:hypothetical protein
MNSRHFSDQTACGSPPAWAGLQDTRFAEVSQRVRKPLYNRIAGGTAHPRSAVGSNSVIAVMSAA